MVESALNLIEQVDSGLVDSTLARIAEFQTLINRSLVANRDYGVIPGTGTKPTLLKPGAEKINMLLQTTPEYEFLDRVVDFKNGFFNYEIRCTLNKIYNIDGVVSKMPVSQGVGSCNSHEKKYKYISVTKTQLPPDVDVSTLAYKKDKYGNTKYYIPNPEPADLANTILKMAKKRAYVDATLQLAALSDIFTQDLEDLRGIIQSDADVSMPEPPQAQPTASASPAGASRTETKPKLPRQHNPGVTVLKFGKYNGMMIANVARSDRGYVEWLADKAQNPVIKNDAAAYLAILDSKTQPAEAKDVTPEEDQTEQAEPDTPPTGDQASFFDGDDDTALPFDI